MLTLRLLGSLDLRGADNQELLPLLRQPKRVALLAYLAAASGRGHHRRDTLLAMLWPELEDGRARDALNQALRFLRHTLGPDVIVSRSDQELGVDRDKLWCDVACFRSFLESGRARDALNLYSGDLLPGFFVDGAREFGDWVDRERTELRDAAARTAQRVAEEQGAKGELHVAIEASQRALELRPDNERVLRDLLNFYERAGDRAGALRSFDAFARRLRDEYEAAPSPETMALVTRLRAATSPNAVASPASPSILTEAAKPNVEAIGEPELGSLRPTEPKGVVPAPIKFGRRDRGRTLAALAALVTITIGAWTWRSAHESGIATAKTEQKWDIALPDTAPLSFVGAAPLGVGHTAVAITRDGSRIAYVAQVHGAQQLFVRQVGELDATPLAGTAGAYQPFFSPDGQWIGYFVRDELKMISSHGGRTVTLAVLEEPFGAVWASDGRILVADGQGFRLSWIPRGGGVAEPIPNRLKIRSSDPELLPGNEWILHAAVDRGLYLSSLVDGRSYVITLDGVFPRDSVPYAKLIHGDNPRFLRSGHIAFFSGENTLMVLPFDLARRKVLGPPASVLSGVRLEMIEGGAQFAVSENGTAVYAIGESARRGHFVWVDHATGQIDTVPVPRAEYGSFDLSPDGRRILTHLRSTSGRVEVWVLDLERGIRTQVPLENAPSQWARWMPSDDDIVITELGSRGSLPGVTVRQSLRTPAKRDTLVRAASILEPSPDGKLFGALMPDRRFALIASDGRAAERTVPGTVWFPTFSPNTQWLAFTEAIDNISEVYVTRLDRPSQRYKISQSGGEEALWTPDGRAIVYRNGRQWMRAAITSFTPFRAARPELLFEGPYLQVPGWSHDMSADGRRELVLLGPPGSTTNRLVLITNWFSEVERLAPKPGVWRNAR